MKTISRLQEPYPINTLMTPHLKIVKPTVFLFLNYTTLHCGKKEENKFIFTYFSLSNLTRYYVFYNVKKHMRSL